MNAGSHMVLFVLKIIVLVGVALTFKPFLTTAGRWNSLKAVAGKSMEVNSFSSRFESNGYDISLTLGFQFLCFLGFDLSDFLPKTIETSMTFS